MSKAAAADAGAAPKKLFSAKLVMMLAVVLLLLAVAGGGAVFMLKQKAAAAAAEEGDDEDTTEVADTHKRTPKRDSSHVPTFLPLDPFTVNLADKDQERYAQVAITLEVDDAKFAEQMKTYMPAIRNGVLMILAHKSSAELLERAGKEKLAAEIQREAVRPLGIEIDDEDEDPPAKAAVDDEAPKKKKRKRKPAVHNPVQHVHFSNFIIQ